MPNNLGGRVWVVHYGLDSTEYLCRVELKENSHEAFGTISVPNVTGKVQPKDEFIRRLRAQQNCSEFKPGDKFWWDSDMWNSFKEVVDEIVAGLERG